mgnify:CR=1 FL=1
MVRMIFSIVHSFFIVISVIIAFQQIQTVVLTAFNFILSFYIFITQNSFFFHYYTVQKYK